MFCASSKSRWYKSNFARYSRRSAPRGRLTSAPGRRLRTLSHEYHVLLPSLSHEPHLPHGIERGQDRTGQDRTGHDRTGQDCRPHCIAVFEASQVLTCASDDHISHVAFMRSLSSFLTWRCLRSFFCEGFALAGDLNRMRWFGVTLKFAPSTRISKTSLVHLNRFLWRRNDEAEYPSVLWHWFASETLAKQPHRSHPHFRASTLLLPISCGASEQRGVSLQHPTETLRRSQVRQK